MEKGKSKRTMLEKIKQFQNNKVLLLILAFSVIFFMILGGITFRYAGVMVIPSNRTHMGLNFYPYENIEPFEKSLYIGWKTIPQGGIGTDAGIFIGYKYQRCGGKSACLEFNCFGWQTINKFQYTDRLGQVEAIESRRCIGIITYKSEWIE